MCALNGSPAPADGPTIIQGGMGVGVSNWRLASAVARTGQLGVVSGVALDVQLARRLQQGDPGGHVRRALDRFPSREITERILRRYLVPGGIGTSGTPYRQVPRLGVGARRASTELVMAGNFVEVYLAKESHHGLVGVNYLEKIQMATPAAVYGAMLAGVDFVLVGAGIPTEIPSLLDRLALHHPVQFPITVAGPAGEHRDVVMLDPSTVLTPAAPLRRPTLLAIISSAVLATRLAREPRTRPDGFILETPIAGGHSAPPRGRLTLDQTGEPVYGPRDLIAVEKVSATGLPFWLAGGYASPRALAEARTAGAAGIQVGTAFALCEESGIEPELKRRLLRQASAGTLRVRNDPHASPTNFPFKIAQISATLSDEELYAARPRLCDLGYLRVPFRAEGHRVGYRCPAEPVDDYLSKGGALEDTIGRRCLCNGLLATIGLAQVRADGYREPPLVTLGQDLDFLPQLLPPGANGYPATRVVDYLLGREEDQPRQREAR